MLAPGRGEGRGVTVNVHHCVSLAMTLFVIIMIRYELRASLVVECGRALVSRWAHFLLGWEGLLAKSEDAEFECVVIGV